MKLSKQQERYLAERCYEDEKGKIVVRPHLINKYCELTHTYLSHKEIKEIIVAFYKEYKSELPDDSFTF